MSSIRFQIEKYQVTLGTDLMSIQADEEAKIIGIIGCIGGGYRLMINFVDFGKIPESTYNEAKKTGTIFTSASYMSYYIDILRNEQPLFAYCSSEHPEWTNISTSEESEDRKQ
jgi:hypothetical protein